MIPEDASAAGEASLRRWESENRLRRRCEEEVFIANEGNTDERLHYSPPSLPLSDDDGEGIGYPDPQNHRLSEDELWKFKTKALSWTNKCENDEDKVIILPLNLGWSLNKVQEEGCTPFRDEDQITNTEIRHIYEQHYIIEKWSVLAPWRNSG